MLFAREAARIRAALGDRALMIEHAGSTSVPGLMAKPIIDIIVAVANSADESTYVPALEAAGHGKKLPGSSCPLVGTCRRSSSPREDRDGRFPSRPSGRWHGGCSGTAASPYHADLLKGFLDMPFLARSFSDWKPLCLALTAAALLVLPGTSLAAATCAELRKQDPSAGDGTYPLTLGGRSVSVYCHDMAGTPREFLALPRTGSTTNYSHYGEGANTSPGGQTTWFTRARLDPAMLALLVDDVTFSTTQGWVKFGDILSDARPLASAGDCVADNSQRGHANVDLTGTPFDIVPGQFVLAGSGAAGSATFSGSQSVNLEGGGYCGGMGVLGGLLRLNWRSAVAPAPELVHNYRFTTSAEDSVGGAHGTLEGGARITQGEVALNGEDAYVSLPISGTLATLHDATFEAWVRWDTLEPKTTTTLFDFRTNGSGMLLLVHADSTSLFVISSSMEKVSVESLNRSFPKGVLTHVVVTIDSREELTRLYVNGLEVGRKASKSTPADLGAYLGNYLGHPWQLGGPFKGAFSEFRIYRTVLSPSLIAAHFNAGAAPRELETSFSDRPANPTNEDSAPFVFSANGTGLRYLCSLDEATFQPCTSPFIPQSLPEGSHTFRVQARDSVGNVESSPKEFSWRVDKTPPETSFASTPELETRQRVPSFMFSSNEPRSTFECSLDQAPFTECPGVFPAMADGDHQLVVRARDEASNVDPDAARYSWRVDNVAPLEPVVEEPAAGQKLFTDRPRFFGTAEPGATVSLFVDGVEAGSARADERGVWWSQPGSPLPWGEHRATALATDKAGNTSDLLSAVPFSTSRRSAYGLGCSTHASSWQGSWPWALLLLGLLRPRSRPFHGGSLH
ncbi:LamG-like jellyroll fold domain-containing protein [Hyalangium gracile]|uniref:LamG-like jellyroll fold domain-containing protein n=1 Tax=Hyalangium gracile TaxID=394092 RepID=UPI001CCE849E|nr:LamG-like jellyroll fold domain-containing protein [Hyalangium gracile]